MRNVVWVHFHEPKDGRSDYFFTSIKQMYERFTSDDLGISKASLYVNGLKPKKVTKECIIRRETLTETEAERI